MIVQFPRSARLLSSYTIVAYLVCFLNLRRAWPAPGGPKNGDLAAGSALVTQANCASQPYGYYNLAAHGSVLSNAIDRFGDTLGGVDSAVSFDQTS